MSVSYSQAGDVHWTYIPTIPAEMDQNDPMHRLYEEILGAKHSLIDAKTDTDKGMESKWLLILQNLKNWVEEWMSRGDCSLEIIAREK